MHKLKHGCALLTLHSANRCRCIFFGSSRYIKCVHNKMCGTQSYPHITTFPPTVKFNNPASTVCGVYLLSLPDSWTCDSLPALLTPLTQFPNRNAYISLKTMLQNIYAQSKECDSLFEPRVQTDIGAYRRHRESVSSALNLQRMKVMVEKRSLSSGP